MGGPLGKKVSDDTCLHFFYLWAPLTVTMIRTLRRDTVMRHLWTDDGLLLMLCDHVCSCRFFSYSVGLSHYIP